MSSALELVTVLARHLVGRPDNVAVKETAHRGTTLIEVFLGGDDFGRLIGRQGRTAAAIRVLASAAAEREGQRVQVEFHDAPEGGA